MFDTLAGGLAPGGPHGCAPATGSPPYRPQHHGKDPRFLVPQRSQRRPRRTQRLPRWASLRPRHSRMCSLQWERLVEPQQVPLEQGAQRGPGGDRSPNRRATAQ
eukprot:7526025-Alexandrium_andersonii.AAC.1